MTSRRQFPFPGARKTNINTGV